MKRLYFIALLVSGFLNSVVLHYSLDIKDTNIKGQINCEYGESVSVPDEHYLIHFTVEQNSDSESVTIRGEISRDGNHISSPVIIAKYDQAASLRIGSDIEDVLDLSLKVTKD